MAKHSRLAASAASRWINCPGSVAYIEFLKDEKRIPQESTSQAAELGTAIHSIIEHAIIDNIAPEAMGAKLLKAITGMPLTKDDMYGAQMCFQYVKNIEDEYCEIFPERKYDMSFIYGCDIGGTSDITAVQWGGLLHIADYKNGRIYVDAENNYQLRIYSLGAYHEFNDEYEFSDVQTTIIQPNSPNKLGTIRSDVITIDELLKWEEKVLIPAVNLIKNETAQLIPGTIQCTWCEARHLCEANATQSFQLAQIDFANVASPKPELPTPKSLTKEQLTFVLDNKERLMQFINACEKHVYDECERHGEFGSYTLQDKLGNRKFIDDSELKKVLRKARLTIKELTFEQEPKFITISQLEAYLLKDKKWPKDKMLKFMDSVTYKPVTGKGLTKAVNTAEQEFSKLKTSKNRKTRK